MGQRHTFLQNCAASKYKNHGAQIVKGRRTQFEEWTLFIKYVHFEKRHKQKELKRTNIESACLGSIANYRVHMKRDLIQQRIQRVFSRLGTRLAAFKKSLTHVDLHSTIAGLSTRNNWKLLHEGTSPRHKNSPIYQRAQASTMILGV